MTLSNNHFIQRQACCFIDVCNERINALVKLASNDSLSSIRLKEAFSAMTQSFFQNPEQFTLKPFVFRKVIEIGLKASDLKEGVDELIDILKGSSETYPLPVVVVDAAGKVSGKVSIDEQRAIRDLICVSVAEKVKFTIQELSRKRKADTQELPDAQALRITQRATFEKLAAAVRAKHILSSTKEGCIQLVTENGLQLEKLDPIFQDNKEVVLAAVKQNGKALQFANARLQNDNEVVFAAIKNTEHALEFAGDAFKNNKEQVLALIGVNELAICYGNDELVENRAFILEAVRKNPVVMQLLDDTLRNDREIVKEAIFNNSGMFLDQHSDALQLVGEQQKAFAQVYLDVMQHPSNVIRYIAGQETPFFGDRDLIVLALVQKPNLYDQIYEIGGEVSTYLDQLKQAMKNPLRYFQGRPQDKNNRNIAYLIINTNSMFLEHVSEELRNDFYIVENTVSQNGLTLQFASERLRNDRKLVGIALFQNAKAFRFIGESQKDFAKVFSEVDVDGMRLRELIPEFQNNEHLVQAAVSQNGLALQYACEGSLVGLRNDRRTVKFAVSQNGLALQFASEFFQDDERSVEAAVSQNGLALQFASERLRNNRRLVGIALLQDPEAFRFVGESQKAFADAFVKVDIDGMRLSRLIPEFQDNKHIVEAAVSQNGLTLQYASGRLRNDRELVGIALLQDPEAFHFVGGSQKAFADAFVKVRIDGMRLSRLIPEFQDNKH
ncbi:MAG: DUF4116 domain-containing protein, partial [Chlamydiota bacterium]